MIDHFDAYGVSGFLYTFRDTDIGVVNRRTARYTLREDNASRALPDRRTEYEAWYNTSTTNVRDGYILGKHEFMFGVQEQYLKASGEVMARVIPKKGGHVLRTSDSFFWYRGLGANPVSDFCGCRDFHSLGLGDAALAAYFLHRRSRKSGERKVSQQRIRFPQRL
jgi:hypothetical protein